MPTTKKPVIPPIPYRVEIYNAMADTLNDRRALSEGLKKLEGTTSTDRRQLRVRVYDRFKKCLDTLKSNRLTLLSEAINDAPPEAEYSAPLINYVLCLAADKVHFDGNRSYLSERGKMQLMEPMRKDRKLYNEGRAYALFYEGSYNYYKKAKEFVQEYKTFAAEMAALIHALEGYKQAANALNEYSRMAHPDLLLSAPTPMFCERLCQRVNHNEAAAAKIVYDSSEGRYYVDHTKVPKCSKAKPLSLKMEIVRRNLVTGSYNLAAIVRAYEEWLFAPENLNKPLFLAIPTPLFATLKQSADNSYLTIVLSLPPWSLQSNHTDTDSSTQPEAYYPDIYDPEYTHNNDCVSTTRQWVKTLIKDPANE